MNVTSEYGIMKRIIFLALLIAVFAVCNTSGKIRILLNFLEIHEQLFNL